MEVLAVENDLASIGLMCSGDDLDERGLAYSVFTGKSVNLSGFDVEVNIIESLNSGKNLSDVVKLKNVFRQKIVPPFVVSKLLREGLQNFPESL